MIAELTLTRLVGFKRGETLRFSTAPVTLGTDVGSHVGFDPTWDRTVSAKHATLEWRDDTWWIRDTSKDGIFLKGRRLPAEEKLGPGTELDLGRGGPRIRLDYVPVVAKAPAPAPSVQAPRPQFTSAPVQPTPAAAPSRAPIAAVVTTIVILVIAGIWLGTRPTTTPSATSSTVSPAATNSGGGTDEALADVARRYEKAIGLVAVVGSVNGAAPQPYAMATAWAIGPHAFATNSHVTATVKEYMKKDLPVFIVINRNPDLKFRVTRATSHPNYEKEGANYDGRQSVGGYDVGILEIAETVTVVMKVAPQSELEKIDSGYRIAYLGFPSERLAGGGVDPRSPVATMQSGIITSATDWWLSKAEFPKRLLFQHNLAATGGASGSPLFNARGEVVALLNAGNITDSVLMTKNGPQATRAPSAAMINFAQRVDLLRDIYPAYPND